ncbi:unnamed protein product [Sphagnum jensenii]|uniref:NADH:flavin oxidoreductase/NADH oxidase N-terminal domain-containing protein n=1 Tax=Sphagnum jensenii TaxID=128206 RepID=A0ABP1B1G9_9BRYO
MGYDNLLSPTQVGDLPLKHRVVMSAMTRTRNDPITESPRELNVLYYTQRATDGGLLISEGAAPCAMGRGYIRAPGVYTEAHLEGWKLVIDAIHSKGGFIFCQLMHAGRVSHSSLLPDNQLPIAPSAVKPDGLVHIKDGAKVPYETPRALETHELPGVVADFANAAKNAISCGFDGIELHAGNGYLLQEFLAKPTNLRTDQYGGSVENRCRFVLEVVDACVEAIGSKKVGIKLQQGVTFSGLLETEEDSFLQMAYLGPELEKRNLAYVCQSSLNGDPYYKMSKLTKPNFEADPFRFFRNHYKGTLMINGALSPEKAEEYVADGTADLVAFGVLFLANANLPALLASGQVLDLAGGWKVQLWYGKNPADDPVGYTDWPLVDAVISTIKSAATAVKETVVGA